MVRKSASWTNRPGDSEHQAQFELAFDGGFQSKLRDSPAELCKSIQTLQMHWMDSPQVSYQAVQLIFTKQPHRALQGHLESPEQDLTALALSKSWDPVLSEGLLKVSLVN